MDHFAMLTPYEQLVETVLHVGQWKLYLGFIEFCEPLEIPDGRRWESLD